MWPREPPQRLSQPPLNVVTVQSAYFDLLDYLQIQDTGSATTGLQARILSDINAVRQTMFLAPNRDFWLIQQGGYGIVGPANVNGVTLTPGAVTISGGTGFLPWMHGCTTQASGDLHQNRLVFLGSSTWAFQFPYGGTGTSQSLTVYNDAIALPANAISIQRPVFVEDWWEMNPIDNYINLREASYQQFTDHGRLSNTFVNTYPMPALAKQTGTPSGYMIEKSPNSDGTNTLRMLLRPMPDTVYALRFGYRYIPAAVTTLTDTTTELAPIGTGESVFLPLLRKKISSYPQFIGDKATITAEAEEAKRILNKGGQEHRDCYISTHN